MRFVLLVVVPALAVANFLMISVALTAGTASPALIPNLVACCGLCIVIGRTL